MRRGVQEPGDRLCGVVSLQLQLNISKTKEVVLDFRQAPPSSQLVVIEGREVEVVRNYKYLGLQLDNKLYWSTNMDCVYKQDAGRTS